MIGWLDCQEKQLIELTKPIRDQESYEKVGIQQGLDECTAMFHQHTKRLIYISGVEVGQDLYSETGGFQVDDQVPITYYISSRVVIGISSSSVTIAVQNPKPS